MSDKEQVTDEDFKKSLESNPPDFEKLILEQLEYHLLYKESIFVSELKKVKENYMLNKKYTISKTPTQNSRKLIEIFEEVYYIYN